MPDHAAVLNTDRLVRLGRYDVVERIATGGMSVIFKAVDRELGQPVALKVLPPERARDPEMLARFQREARSVAKVNHENVVTIFELGEASGLHYMALELVEGIDLERYVEERGRLEVAEALLLLRQMAAAIDHVYRHGIIHRDVKPANFLITQKDGRPLVKLTDLGLALDQLSTEERLTRLGTTVGTFDYMAPEQTQGGVLADVRSDIYGLGCTLYFMLTGEPPFPSKKVTEIVYKHLHVQPPDPRRVNAAIPPGVTRVLDRMLKKRPEDRYQAPRDLLADLDRLTKK
jgi:serine/threonine protein kinase